MKDEENEWKQEAINSYICQYHLMTQIEIWFYSSLKKNVVALSTTLWFAAISSPLARSFVFFLVSFENKGSRIVRLWRSIKGNKAVLELHFSKQRYIYYIYIQARVKNDPDWIIFNLGCEPESIFSLEVKWINSR